MDVKYAKLKDLVGSTIMIKSVGTPKYKMWSDVDKRMVVQDGPGEGFRKLYPVETDQGKLDLGSGQIGTLLETVQSNGSADIVGKRFAIKSNGKQGADIRYFFNLIEFKPAPEVVVASRVKDDVPPIEAYDDLGIEEDEIDLSSIPF